jgi:hypothetical protein
MPTWLPGAGVGSLALLVGALFLLGVTPVIGALSRVAAVLIDGLRMLLEHIIIPGMKNIASNGASIICVCGIAYGAYLYADANNARTEVQLAKSRDYFATELRGFKVTLAKTRQELAQCKSAVNKKLSPSTSGWPF